MPPLNGAVPLKKVNAIAMLVCNDLDFNVSRVFNEFLHKHAPIAKSCFCLSASLKERIFQLLLCNTSLFLVCTCYNTAVLT